MDPNTVLNMPPSGEQQNASPSVNMTNPFGIPVPQTQTQTQTQAQAQYPNVVTSIQNSKEAEFDAARDSIETILGELSTKTAEASAAFNKLVPDGFVYSKKSPLAYLLYTNRELIKKAREEIALVDNYRKTVKQRGAVYYKTDAKFPSTGLLGKFRGGKTARNRKARRA
jgi:hypothetical protein